jgi:hypothetical protein
MQRMTLKLDRQLADALETAAREHGQPMATFVRDCARIGLAIRQAVVDAAEDPSSPYALGPRRPGRPRLEKLLPEV